MKNFATVRLLLITCLQEALISSGY